MGLRFHCEVGRVLMTQSGFAWKSGWALLGPGVVELKVWEPLSKAVLRRVFALHPQEEAYAEA